jgi:uroporphyrinogen-III synthase
MEKLKAIIWTCSDPVQSDWLKHDIPIIKTLHWPLTELKALPISKPKGQPESVIVTSRFALERIITDETFEALRVSSIVFITFGEKTYERLKTAGYHAQLIQADGAKEMCEKLIGEQKRYVWYIASDKPAFDVVSYLQNHGWKAEHIKAYSSQPRSITDLAVSMPSSENLSAAMICFANPLAVEAFANVKSQFLAKLNLDTKNLTYLAIGKTTKAQCEKRLGPCAIATHKDFKSLYLSAVASVMTK